MSQVQLHEWQRSRIFKLQINGDPCPYKQVLSTQHFLFGSSDTMYIFSDDVGEPQYAVSMALLRRA